MRTPIGFRYSHTIGLLAQSGRGFSLPVDCALGPDGVLYVLNRGTPLQRNVHVTICTTAGDYRADFGAYGTGDGQFIRPTAIAVDREGDVYVSAESEHCIRKFSPTGISSIISGDELTCLAGLPGAAKAGIMALDPCNFPVLEPRATCLKTLT